MSLMDNVGLPLKQALPHADGYAGAARHARAHQGDCVRQAGNAGGSRLGLLRRRRCGKYRARVMFSIGCIQALRCHTNSCPTGITTHKKSLQGGLDPKVKGPRVASYVEKMRKDVAMIAHSCGAAHARNLKRFHVRIQQEDGGSVPLDELTARFRPMAPENERDAG